MIYHSLTVSGFGPYEGKHVFSFDTGLNVITGSNGSGKSSVFDAIQWVLFGPAGSFRTLKDRTSIINDSSQRATVVLEIASEELGDIVIKRGFTRSKSHTLEFEVSGQPKLTGIKNAQEAISSLLGGLQSDSFSAMSMLVSSPSHSINNFITGNPRQRREVLYDLADPQKLMEKRHKEVKKEITLEKPRRDKHSGEVEMLESLLEDLEEVKKPKGNLKNWENRKKEVVLRLNHLLTNSGSTKDILRIEELSRKLSEVKTTRDDLQAEIVGLKSDKISLKDEIEEIEKSTKRNNALIKKIDKKIYRAQAEYDAGLMLIESLERLSRSAEKQYELNIKKMNKEKLYHEILIESGDVCLVCGSDIKNSDIEDSHYKDDNDSIDFEAKKQSYDYRLSLTKGRIDNLEGRIAQFESKKSSLIENEDELDSLVEEHEDVQNRIKEIEKILASIPDEIKSLETEIQRLENVSEDDDYTEEINELNKENEELEEKISSYKDNIRRFEDYEKRRDEYSERLEDAKDAFESSEKLLRELEKEKFATSVKGDISTKIAEIMDMISDTSTEIYEQFFDVDMDIELVSDTGENDEETCLIVVNDRDLASYSHGEQSRIISALMVGMANAISETTGEWVPPLWDEPTISMDDKYSEEFYTSLDQYALEKEEQVMIISRDVLPELDANIVEL